MCFGGGGGGETHTTTVDPVYNAGLLEIAKEDQDYKRLFMNMFQYAAPYDPNEVIRGAYVDGKWVDEADLPKVGTPGKTITLFGQELQVEGTEKIDPKYEIVEKTAGEIHGYDPSTQTSEMQYIQNLVNANQELLPLLTELSRKELGLAGDVADATRELIPAQTEASRQAALLSGEQSESRRSLLPDETEAARQTALLSGEQAAAKREIVPLRTNLLKTTLSDIDKGIDVGARMDEAQAGVQHGMKLANKAARRDIASYGLSPDAGRYDATRRGAAMNEATGIAAARTGAKNLAEDEDFKRKVTGIQLIQ